MKCNAYLFLGYSRRNTKNKQEEIIGWITDSNKTVWDVEELRKRIESYFVITREETVCGGNIKVSVKLDEDYCSCGNISNATIEITPQCEK